MNKHTHQEYIQKLFETNKYYRDKEIFLLSEYIDSKTPIKVIDKYSNEYLLVDPLKLLKDHFPTILTCIDKSKHFKQRATLVHSGKYTYENTIYKNASDKVAINCPIHGDFLQRPHCHLAGQGCLKCKDILNGEQKAMPKGGFLQKASSIFGDTYKYDMSTFKSGNVKMTITCPIHGNFEQSPINHLKGKGCKQCSIENFVYHGEKYSYSAWGKLGMSSKKFDSFKLYIIECSSDDQEESFIKVGKTYRNIKDRFTRVNMPYRYNIVGLYKSDNHLTVSAAESEIKGILSEYRYKPTAVFDGMYECFSKDGLTNSNLECVLSKLEIVE